MVRKVALFLVLAGVLISGYLALAHLRGAHVVCVGGGCERVQMSDYSEVFGIPVALFGFAYYVVLTCLILWEWLAFRVQKALDFAAALSVMAAVISLVLTGIEAFVIRAYCIWCLASAAISLLLVPITLRIRARDDVVRDSTLAAFATDRQYAAFLVCIAVLIGVRGSFIIRPPVRTEPPEIQLTRLLADSTHRMGREDAPHTIVEFSDFQCPKCRKHYQALRRFMKKDTGQIRWVFRHRPLPGHKRSLPASIAAEAAAEQGKFWEMADVLFRNQSRLEDKDIARYARAIGLGMDRFREDLRKKEVKERVLKDLHTAQALFINSTPTTYVDGKRFTDKLTEAALESIAAQPNTQTSVSLDRAGKAPLGKSGHASHGPH